MSVRFVPRWAVAAGAATVLLSSCATSEPDPQNASVPPAMEDAATSPDATQHATGDDDAMVGEADDVVVNDKLTFQATTVSGEAFDGTDLAGTDTILWFWASWCPTCQAEAPGVAAAAAQLPEGVTMYGVPGKSDQAGMENFIDSYDLDGIEHIVDGDGSLWSTFEVPYQPAFALINDTGEITVIQGSMGRDGILDAANSLLEG
ncbi:redoxin family protein [Demequina sp. TTPB684]|uniref:redoxin family protein n=1 Tax=unclassified Demequina TaxID=2620311 RepID=UPI001CF0F101|nr:MULTISPECIES: redoxin family protein [unclassified Demequina]MCB2413423.1 redoxin family protein [Demequina sp. TTPB684]UPU87986.1 redoxin family protein [Demequina sp. TMPB413]